MLSFGSSLLHASIYAYPVEDSSLGRELEEAKDGEVEAVNGGEAATAGVEDIGLRRTVDVVCQPESAESFF